MITLRQQKRRQRNSKSWDNEDELKQLKSDLAALDRKITSALAPQKVEQDGESPGRHIRQFIIRQIKNELASGLTVAEVAYKLGFEYPAHLSRMFKKETGMTPTDYIQSRNK